MYSIENISIKEYFELLDSSEYDIFVDTLTPNNVFNGKRFDVTKFTFDDVKIVQGILNNATIDNIKDLYIQLFKLGSYDVNANVEFYNTSIFDLFRTKKYINDYIIKLINTESKVLSGIPDPKMMRVNAGEKLKVVSHLLTKMRLAEQFNTSPDEIGKWKYTTVFPILLANKLNNDVQREYAQLK